MHRPGVLMIAALMVGGLVSCSEDEPTSSTTHDQPAVAVEDETTTASTEQQTTSATSLPATSTVTVTVTNVEDAVGYDLAGVLYRGDGLEIKNAVGGFGAAVDADPFSTTQVVRAPQPDLDIDSYRPESAWPYVTDEPLMLEPGTYRLQLWLGESPLCCYSVPWVPADSSTLTGCGTVFTVKADEQLAITVSGIPPRSTDGPQVECPMG